MNVIRKLWMLLLLVPSAAIASGAGVQLDKAPIDLEDNVSLQRGAKLFTSYCLSCHSASSMRYNRLTDIGLGKEQIKKVLELPEDIKLGSTMQAAMDNNSAKLAFGAAPPDLSVIARARGQDWLYTYMRSFYADPKRSSGANNTVFRDVGMPNVLAGLQGVQELHVENHDGHETRKLVLVSPGSMTAAEFDTAIADLTGFMVFMGEPARLVRYKLGVIVLIFLSILFVLVYALKKEIWKDIH